MRHRISPAAWEIVFAIGFPPAVKAKQVIYMIEDRDPARCGWTLTATPDEYAELCADLRSGDLGEDAGGVFPMNTLLEWPGRRAALSYSDARWQTTLAYSMDGRILGPSGAPATLAPCAALPATPPSPGLGKAVSV